MATVLFAKLKLIFRTTHGLSDGRRPAPRPSGDAAAGRYPSDHVLISVERFVYQTLLIACGKRHPGGVAAGGTVPGGHMGFKPLQ